MLLRAAKFVCLLSRARLVLPIRTLWQAVSRKENDMKARLVSALVVMLTAIVGCSGIYGVNYDEDSSFDFQQLKTFDWGPVDKDDGTDAPTLQHIQSAVDKKLQSKGYRQSRTSPDFILTAHVENRQRLAGTPDPYQAAFGPYTAPPAQYHDEAYLELKIVSADDRHLIWRGSASASLYGIKTPEQLETTVNAAVQKILRDFPERSF